MSVKKNTFKKTLLNIQKTNVINIQTIRILYVAYRTDENTYLKNYKKLFDLSKYGNDVINRYKTMQTMNYQNIEYYILKYGKEIGIIEYNKYVSKKSSYNTKESFIERFGVELGTKKWDEKIESFSGKNNPAYNHSGKNSPWSKNSSFYSEESKQKAKESRVKNSGNNSTIEYWISRGYTQEDYKNRQSTFSLVKCIQKYGDDIGQKVWSERQKKWLNSYYSKSIDELSKINSSKGMDKFGNPHTYYNKDLCNKRPELSSIQSQLYYVKLTKDDKTYFKIGITKHNVSKRLGSEFCGYKVDVLHTINDTLKNVIDIEQTILNSFKIHRVFNPDTIKSTEIFTKDIFEGKYDEIIRYSK